MAVLWICECILPRYSHDHGCGCPWTVGSRWASVLQDIRWKPNLFLSRPFDGKLTTASFYLLAGVYLAFIFRRLKGNARIHKKVNDKLRRGSRHRMFWSSVPHRITVLSGTLVTSQHPPGFSRRTLNVKALKFKDSSCRVQTWILWNFRTTLVLGRKSSPLRPSHSHLSWQAYPNHRSPLQDYPLVHNPTPYRNSLVKPDVQYPTRPVSPSSISIMFLGMRLLYYSFYLQMFGWYTANCVAWCETRSWAGVHPIVRNSRYYGSCSYRFLIKQANELGVMHFHRHTSTRISSIFWTQKTRSTIRERSTRGFGEMLIKCFAKEFSRETGVCSIIHLSPWLAKRWNWH